MSYPGIGVMLKDLFGGEESVKAFVNAVNNQIKNARLENDSFVLTFTDNTRLQFHDDGQSCCENRYMVCDDNLAAFTNATFLDAELLNAPDMEDSYGVHEVQFLHIRTSAGTITISNHNEHNGYYGGFALRCSQ